MEKQNWTSIFVFHFSSSGRKWNSNSLNALRFSFSVAQKKKILSFFFVFCFRMEFWKRITIRFCFFFFGLWYWNWQSLCKRENVLDQDFVRRVLIEQKHTYEGLVTEIKARYQNPKGCSLRSVKMFCNHQEIRKRMPVLDEALKVPLSLGALLLTSVGKKFSFIFCREWMPSCPITLRKRDRS